MSNTKDLKCKSCENIVVNVGLDACSVTCSICVSRQIGYIEKIYMDETDGKTKEQCHKV